MREGVCEKATCTGGHMRAEIARGEACEGGGERRAGEQQKHELCRSLGAVFHLRVLLLLFWLVLPH